MTPQTEPPPAVTTDVLVVGSGPAGGAMALALAELGVDHLVVTRHDALAREPRSHVTNQRTMEVLADLGVADAVAARSTPQHLTGTIVYCTSLAGEELARLRGLGTHPHSAAAHRMASPGQQCDIPQNLLEPILVSAATARGSRVRFATEYLTHHTDAEGVTVTVRDRTREDEGATYRVRARYLYGADGGRSRVAAAAGLPMRGRMGVAGALNVVFRADLTPWTAHRPGMLAFVVQPGTDAGGVGLGVVRMVRPFDEWMAIWNYDPAEGPPELSTDRARDLVRRLVGLPDLDVEIVGWSAWTVNDMVARCYTDGRVLCGGDAVHRHPPPNGLGSNTSIQDSFNLAWKLAHVLDGRAGPGLLDTYTVERAPVGAQVVARANRSVADMARIVEALGVAGATDPDVMRDALAERTGTGPEAARRRRALRDAVRFKQTHEFDAHGIELNHRYASCAVLPDDLAADPLGTVADPELAYVPTTTPGARVPHVWLGIDGREVSSVTLCGGGRFTLLTGPGGEPWAAAPDVVSGLARLVVVGPGRTVEDLYGDWATQLEADGVGDAGAVLVRPDHHVAARFPDLPADPGAVLTAALDRVLSRG